MLVFIDESGDTGRRIGNSEDGVFNLEAAQALVFDVFGDGSERQKRSRGIGERYYVL